MEEVIVYTVKDVARLFEYGSKKWEEDGSLLQKSTLEGIITSNTDYSPGETIYRVYEKIKINLETLYSITAFSVVPVVQKD